VGVVNLDLAVIGMRSLVEWRENLFGQFEGTLTRRFALASELMTRTSASGSFDEEVVDWPELAGGGGLRKRPERREEKRRWS